MNKVTKTSSKKNQEEAINIEFSEELSDGGERNEVIKKQQKRLSN